MNEKFQILIAEDDHPTRMLLAKYFSEKGYEVFSVENGLEGVRILERQVVDLVITDYTMPYMGGKEFIIHIKKNNPRLPVILVSGFDRHENKDLQLIKGDLYEYFEKPVNLGLLHAAVQKFQWENHYE